MTESIIYRSGELTNKDVSIKDRKITFSWASPTPVKRYFGNEILSMDPGALRSERLSAGAVPFLLNHAVDNQIGSIVSHFQRGEKWYATAKISRSQQGEDYLQDAADNLRPGISFGYRTHRLTRIRKADPQIPGDVDDFRVDDYEPLEISAVSIAADSRVGIGRADDAPFDLRGVDITDEAGNPIQIRGDKGDVDAEGDEREALFRSIQEEATFRFDFEKSGLTIAQLRCVDAFLKLPGEVRIRIIKS